MLITSLHINYPVRVTHTECLLDLHRVVSLQSRFDKPVLAAFAKLRNATISFMSVCPMEPLGSHWTNYHEIWYLSIFFFLENLLIKFKFHYSLTRTAGTSHADRYTFIITSRSVHLIKRNVSQKSCKESKNTHFMFNIFFSRKSCRLWDNVEK